MRKLKSWLQGLRVYIEDTEAPRHFWQWAGISTIASALQRKVWLPFGMENYYPNLHILLIGPPASRKGNAVSFSKKILTEIQVPVSRDSLTRRELTKRLAAVRDTEHFIHPETKLLVAQSTISVISKEFSSLLSTDPKGVIELLTDLWDCHDVWDHGTSEKGEDILYNVCVNALIASTPTSIAENLPKGAIGGGWSSRQIIVYGEEVYKRVTWPQLTEKQMKVYKALVNDLNHIHNITGIFEFDEKAYSMFDTWYQGIDSKIKEVKDERLHPFIGRMHAVILKTAMCLHIDYSDELKILPSDIELSIQMTEDILKTAAPAFGGFGPSKIATDIHRIRNQIRTYKNISLRELLSTNLHHMGKNELLEVLATLEAAGDIRRPYETEKNQTTIYWIERKDKRYG